MHLLLQAPLCRRHRRRRAVPQYGTVAVAGLGAGLEGAGGFQALERR